MVNDRNIRLGFLASHNGSTMQAIVDACISNLIKAEPVVLISNNSSSGAMTRAREMKIPFHHLSSATHPNFEDLDKAITKTLKKYSVDLVLLTGYMKKIGSYTLDIILRIGFLILIHHFYLNTVEQECMEEKFIKKL
ncbi:MAG: phosphoribosylglycinamide formyltransferase [Dehalococcoidia bacterium]